MLSFTRSHSPHFHPIHHDLTDLLTLASSLSLSLSLSLSFRSLPLALPCIAASFPRYFRLLCSCRALRLVTSTMCFSTANCLRNDARHPADDLQFLLFGFKLKILCRMILVQPTRRILHKLLLVSSFKLVHELLLKGSLLHRNAANSPNESQPQSSRCSAS